MFRKTLIAILLLVFLPFPNASHAVDPCRDALDNPGLHDNPARAVMMLNACLDNPLARAEERAEARLERGFAFASLGREDKALADYSAVIRRFPDYAPAYSFRGSLLLSQFKLGRAIADFSQALKLEPADTGSWWNRSLAYELKGDIKKALADAERYLALVPQDGQAKARLEKLKKRDR